jgi:uncharacterized protein YggT (Ycf19 family)
MRELICILILAFQFVFFVRLAMSFFPISSGTPASSVRDLTVAITDPLVLPLRRSLPPLPGMMAGFGVAEIVVLIGLIVLEAILC